MASSDLELNTCREIVPYVPRISGAPVMALQKQIDNTKFILEPTPISSQPIQNDVETIIIPQRLARKKRSLVTTKAIENTLVDFVIVPSEGATNLYTIKLKKNEDQASDSYGLNSKYYDMLHGWKAERRQRQNGICETFYFHESKRSMCRSIGDVRRYIFKGFENLKVDVHPETNVVIESMVGIMEKKSKKRKRDSSNSKKELAVQKRKTNGQHSIDKSETPKFLDEVWNNLMNMDELYNNQVTFVKTTITNCGYTKIHH
uniref:MBD domain-containing protein n=1 Tax=Solanum lycopersicum TaxID=4081 RepID=K4CYY5_SOLLC